MTAPSCNKPPVTEAVIELRFADTLPGTDVERASSLFASLRKRQEMVLNFNVSVGLPASDGFEIGNPIKQDVAVGRRRSTKDATQIVNRVAQVFALALLPSYLGWEVLACAARQYRIRVLHKSPDGEPAHSAIRQLPRDDLSLIEVLASEVFPTIAVFSGSAMATTASATSGSVAPRARRRGRARRKTSVIVVSDTWSLEDEARRLGASGRQLTDLIRQYEPPILRPGRRVLSDAVSHAALVEAIRCRPDPERKVDRPAGRALRRA